MKNFQEKKVYAVIPIMHEMGIMDALGDISGLKNFQEVMYKLDSTIAKEQLGNKKTHIFIKNLESDIIYIHRTEVKERRFTKVTSNFSVISIATAILVGAISSMVSILASIGFLVFPLATLAGVSAIIGYINKLRLDSKLKEALFKFPINIEEVISTLSKG